MSEDKTGGPAFPQLDNNFLAGTTESKGGMTLRDWFAGMALQGFCANSETFRESFEKTAEMALKQADAMLKARETK